MKQLFVWGLMLSLIGGLAFVSTSAAWLDVLALGLSCVGSILILLAGYRFLKRA